MISQQAFRSQALWTSLATLVLLAVCSCQSTHRGGGDESTSNDAVDHSACSQSESLLAAARGLQSADWEQRCDAIQQLAEFKTEANEVVLPVLQDRNEVVRKAAQFHYIDQGEAAIPFLVNHLVTVNQDEGYFASIAGGVERSEMKSLAGTLWYTLVRGVPPERRFELVSELITHDHPRVRAVGVFAVASMREARYLNLLEPIATEHDPMIRWRYWEALLLLLMRKGPDLEESSYAQVLTLLEREMVPLLNSDELGVAGRAQTFGYVLTFAGPPESLKMRFLDLLRYALDDQILTGNGAIRVGASLSRRLSPEDCSREFKEIAGSIQPDDKAGNAIRRMAALAAFPQSAYDLAMMSPLMDCADRLAAQDSVSAPGLPRLAASFLLRALAEGDEGASERAMDALTRWIAHVDSQFSLQAAIGHLSVLVETEKAVTAANADSGDIENQDAYVRVHAELVESAKSRSDELFSVSSSISHRELNELIRLFHLIGDARYLNLFEILWSRRWDDDPGINGSAITAVLWLSRLQDRAVLPYILEYAESPEGRWHHSLRDVCVSVLLGNSRYGALLQEFMTPERLERWVEIIDDPDLYPRTRACFFPILKSKGLSPEHKETFSRLALKYTRQPFDSNLRSKTIIALGSAGDTRVFESIRAIALEEDHPWWIWENVIPTLAKLHGAPATSWNYTPEGPVPKKAITELVNLLEEQLATMTRQEGVRFAYTHNYYSWGIEYLKYPPDITLHFLEQFTHQDWGFDIDQWRTWLSSQGEVLE